MTRKTLAVFAFVLCSFSLFPLHAKEIIDQSTLPAFKEIWAYLMRGEESEITGDEPITHIFLFGASLNTEGRITSTIARPAIQLKSGVKPDIHLVVAELSNSSLMHFSLSPAYGVRPLLIEDICRVSDGFDGVQIDFEAVSRDDAEYFLDFLKELKARLPAGRMLSVALPARTAPSTGAYDYSRIAPLVDKIVIMAYDEHWSTSEPGPVASLSWCAKIVDYATGTIANDKIIMGLPLYGRAWPDKRLARALRFKSVLEMVAEKKGEPSYSLELGAHFEYSENVVVKVFFDDERTISEKLNLYRGRGVTSVAFWRIGQGPPGIWNRMRNAGPGSAAADSADLAASEGHSRSNASP
jgi:spore germination protein